MIKSVKFLHSGFLSFSFQKQYGKNPLKLNNDVQGNSYKFKHDIMDNSRTEHIASAVLKTSFI